MKGVEMNFTIVTDEEWVGIYLDGHCLLQDHTLSAEQLLKELRNLQLIKLEEKYCDGDWLESEGYLPENLEDVVIDE